jgi:hypothetical protein
MNRTKEKPMTLMTKTSTPAPSPSLLHPSPEIEVVQTATDAVLDLLVVLHDGSREELTPTIRAAALAFRRAFDQGVSLDAVLDRILDLTGPPVAPPPPPWTPLLALPLTDFPEAGMALHVMLPVLGESIWLVGDAAMQQAVVRYHRTWDRYVKLPGWLAHEADRLALPASERTVGQVLTALGGRVVASWRP